MGRDGDLIEIRPDQLERGERPLAAAENEWKPGSKEYAVMVTLSVISLMVALDATILVSVLPTLAIDLGGTATDAFWAGTSYLLSCAVCQPFIAALSDIFGRKEMLLLSVFFFTIGTILCAPVAKDFTVFFVGRSIQGIGGGGIITMGQVIFADIVPLRQRPKYFSMVLAAWALGSVLGPLIGGLFVEHVIWAWCFYINLPFCAVGLVLVPIYVKLKTQKTSIISKLRRVDWLGGFLFIGGMTSFLIGLSWAGIQFEWKSAETIAPMVVGIVGVVASLFWECYGAVEPFLRPSLFNSRSTLATYAIALFQGFILFCALYYIPFYFTAIKFHRPTRSGLDIFPVTCFLLPGSIIISLMTTRLGRYRWAIWSGGVVTAIACGLLVLFRQHTKTAVWAVILAVFGIGNGMLLTSVNIGIQAASRVEDAGRAAAMYAFMRTLGMSIGVAVGGTVFQNVMSNKLNELGLPTQISKDSEAFVAKMYEMAPEDPVRIGAQKAYLSGFHGVYWTITGAAVASFLISLLIKQYSMDKLLATKFVLKGASRPVMVSSAAGPDEPSDRVDNAANNTTSCEEITPAEETKLVPTETVTSAFSPLPTPAGTNLTVSDAIMPAPVSGSIHPSAPSSSTTSQPSSAPATSQQHGLSGESEQAAIVYLVRPGGAILPVKVVQQRRQPAPSYDDAVAATSAAAAAAAAAGASGNSEGSSSSAAAAGRGAKTTQPKGQAEVQAEAEGQGQGQSEGQKTKKEGGESEGEESKVFHIISEAYFEDEEGHAQTVVMDYYPVWMMPN